MLRAISCHVSYCPVAWQVPLIVHYPQRPFPIIRIIGSFARGWAIGQLGLRYRAGWGGTVQKPSNLVGYYTMAGYLVGTIYLTCEILCVAHDRVGQCVMIGRICCYNITQPTITQPTITQPAILHGSIIYLPSSLHRYRVIPVHGVTIRCQAIVGSLYSIRAAMFHVKHIDDKKPALWGRACWALLWVCMWSFTHYTRTADTGCDSARALDYRHCMD